MEHTRTSLREIITSLLKHGPEKGARLRQRLDREWLRRFGRRLGYRELGHMRFSAFLAANSDLFVVVRPEGPGDITVSLREQGEAGPEPETRQRIRLPTPLWQAFTNPDPNRKRFYNRSNGRIVHFVEDDQGPQAQRLKREVAVASEEYVPIRYVPGEQQKQWALEWLENAGVAPAQKKLAIHFLETDYSSSLNQAFAQMLGPRGPEWREAKGRHVVEWVRHWASENEVEISGVTQARPDSDQAERVSLDIDATSLGDGADRRALHELVESLEEEELQQVMLPMTVVARLLARTRDAE